MQGSYPEYLKWYLNLDADKLAIARNGFSLLIAIHFLEVTSPGQDKATVEKVLKDKLKINH